MKSSNEIKSCEEHNWGYIDKEHRRCTKCGKRELLYSREYFGNVLHEDWRLWWKE